MSCLRSVPLLMVVLNLLWAPPENLEFMWIRLLFERIWFQHSEKNYQSLQCRKFRSHSDKAAPGGHTATGLIKWGCSSLEVALHYFAIFSMCFLQWQPVQGSLKHNIHIYCIYHNVYFVSSLQLTGKNEYIHMNLSFDSNTKVVLHSLIKTTDQCPAAFGHWQSKYYCYHVLLRRDNNRCAGLFCGYLDGLQTGLVQ